LVAALGLAGTPGRLVATVERVVATFGAEVEVEQEQRMAFEDELPSQGFASGLDAPFDISGKCGPLW